MTITSNELALRQRTKTFITAIEGMAGLSPEAIGYTLLGEDGLAHWLACRDGTAFLDDAQFVKAFDRVTHALPFCPVDLPPELEAALTDMQAQRSAAKDTESRKKALSELTPKTRTLLLAALKKFSATEHERKETLRYLKTEVLRIGRHGMQRAEIMELRQWCGIAPPSAPGLPTLPAKARERVLAVLAAAGYPTTKAGIKEALQEGALDSAFTRATLTPLRRWCGLPDLPTPLAIERAKAVLQSAGYTVSIKRARNRV